MMFVGFLGCYGAIQESQCLLGTVREEALDAAWQHGVPPGSAWLCFPCWRIFQHTGLGRCMSTEMELADLCKEHGSTACLRASLPSPLNSG